MSEAHVPIRVRVDPANPGQFFACCGLLELADRHRPGAEGWFEPGEFNIQGTRNLGDLLRAVAEASLIQLDPSDMTGSAMEVETPTGRLRLDWWQDELAGGKELKVWAGSMESVRIARAMQQVLRDSRFHGPDLLDVGTVVYDPDQVEKKVEPFYFDARRAPNAHSRDVGFSPNDLQMTTTAFPAVEFLCLIGLQRCRPARTGQTRIFDYATWGTPLPPAVLPAAVTGLLPQVRGTVYRFENWYRTGQRKHKAFRQAIPLSPRGPL
jgi:hypothetical protein